jgi:CheY-like chemotaxis protein
VLAYRGYQIVEAEDGEDALRKYTGASPPFDLVVMDVHLPRLNGCDALQRMRERDPLVKAILLSGGLNEQEFDRPGTLQGVKFLQKPFQNHELVRAVRDTLDAQ